MIKYSRMNKGYKYIFTNIDIFSKYAWSFPIKLKKYKILNLAFKGYLKNENLLIFGVIKNLLFFSKEMLKFFEDNNVKIYYTFSNLKAVFIERFNRSLRELMMKEFVKNDNTIIIFNILV